MLRWTPALSAAVVVLGFGAAAFAEPDASDRDPPSTHALEPEASDRDPPSTHAPEGFLLGVSPGFGAAFESTPHPCTVEGTMFTGGFFAGHAMFPGVVGGLSLTMRVNRRAHERGACQPLEGSSHLVLASVVGPSLHYYPLPDSLLHFGVTLGYASIEQSSGPDELRIHGLGQALSVGYRWPLARDSRVSIGAAFDTTVFLMFAERQRTIVVPAVLGQLFFD